MINVTNDNTTKTNGIATLTSETLVTRGNLQSTVKNLAKILDNNLANKWEASNTVWVCNTASNEATKVLDLKGSSLRLLRNTSFLLWLNEDNTAHSQLNLTVKCAKWINSISATDKELPSEVYSTTNKTMDVTCPISVLYNGASTSENASLTTQATIPYYLKKGLYRVTYKVNAVNSTYYFEFVPLSFSSSVVRLTTEAAGSYNIPLYNTIAPDSDKVATGNYGTADFAWNNDLTYSPSESRLSVPNVSVSNGINLLPSTTQYGIPRFENTTGQVGNTPVLLTKSAADGSVDTINAAYLTITGGASIQTLAVSTNASIGGDLSVVGGASIQTLAVSTNASIGGDLSVVGGASVLTLAVSTNASIGGDLSVVGGASVLTLAVSTNASIGGDLGITGGLTVTGAAALNGGLTVTGAAALNGGLSILNTKGTGSTSVVVIDTDGLVKSLSSSIGTSTAPVYVNSNGEIAQGSSYAGGTLVTLNGTGCGGSTAGFFAPTAAGTAGNILVSSGGAPGWKSISVVRSDPCYNADGEGTGTPKTPITDASLSVTADDNGITITLNISRGDLIVPTSGATANALYYS